MSSYTHWSGKGLKDHLIQCLNYTHKEKKVHGNEASCAEAAEGGTQHQSSDCHFVALPKFTVHNE